MEDVNVETSGESTEQTVVESVEQNQQKDTVAYESYKKLLGEKKRRDAQLRDAMSKLEALEQADMESKGKQTELIDSLRKQLSEQQQREKEKDQRNAWNSVKSQITQAALENGCTAPSKLIKLLDKADLDTLQVDDDYSVNRDDLTRLMEKAKKDNEFIFTVAKAPVKDVNPGLRESDLQAKPKDPRTMSEAEIRAALMEDVKTII